MKEDYDMPQQDMIGWLIAHSDAAGWLILLASMTAFLLGLTWHSRQHPHSSSLKPLPSQHRLTIQVKTRSPKSIDP